MMMQWGVTHVPRTQHALTFLFVGKFWVLLVVVESTNYFIIKFRENPQCY